MKEYAAQDIVSFQVLQRDLLTNEAVIISSDGQKVTLKTGGPYTVEDKHDIYVGDIWVMAGQSNMRGHGFLKEVFGKKDESEKMSDHVHLFDSTETWRVASDPTHRLSLSKRSVHHTLPDPTVRNPDICKYRGASLGPSFGLHYGIPVGLIASAHGGVTLNDWKRPSELNTETRSATLYGAMMDRIQKVGAIAGILWYQGESDTEDIKNAESYGDRFRQWLNMLRADTRPDLPVVVVQLGSHRVDIVDTVKNWMAIQDQQRQLQDNNTACIGSIDCGLDDRVHLSKDGLYILGKRLARAANLVLKGKSDDVTPSPKLATYEEVVYVPKFASIHSIKLEFNLPEHFRFECIGDVTGFEIESKAVILRSRIEDDKKSIRLYLSGNPKEGCTW
ncbi:hypothetical protein INT47_005252 [Mucor saturninus]|uniref:Sialate O-acetylesterase domain-containing protein n=1 Tax=Mucor saturninus TaxID=64648 RepID=A0A8H7R4U8_9FUNG|nr:hypothetical protein INT47_005252 [Mucor saturninus]